MKVKHIITIVTILAAGLLSACSSTLRGSSWSGLAADDKMAYLADGTYVYAVRLSNGSEAWRYPQKADSKKLFFATPVLTSDGQLIVGSSGSNYSLFSLNPENGQENWAFTQANDRWIGGPLIANGTIYAPNADGNLYALDLKGGLRWIFSAKAPLWAQPATDDKAIYVTTLDHRLLAVDPQSGESLWDDVRLDGAIAGSPVVGTNDLIYVGTFGSKMTAIDTTSQAIRWSAPTEGWIWGSPTLSGEALYFGDLSGRFYALNTANGERIWEPLQPDGPIVGSPLLISDYLIITTESGSVYAIDQEGKIAWSKVVGGQIYTTPVAAGDLILIAPMQTEFYLAAMDKNGNQVWTFTPVK